MKNGKSWVKNTEKGILYAIRQEINNDSSRYGTIVPTERKDDMGRRFNVKPSRLRDISDELYGQSRKASQMSEEIFDVARGLRGISGMEEVCRILKRIAEDANYDAKLLKGLSDSMLQIGASYSRAENNIAINGERSKQRFPVHKVANWGVANAAINPIWFKLLRE